MLSPFEERRSLGEATRTTTGRLPGLWPPFRRCLILALALVLGALGIQLPA